MSGQPLKIKRRMARSRRFDSSICCSPAPGAFSVMGLAGGALRVVDSLPLTWGRLQQCPEAQNKVDGIHVSARTILDFPNFWNWSSKITSSADTSFRPFRTRIFTNPRES